jgi:HEAT repeat protein
MEDYTELVKTLKGYDWGQSGAALLLIDGEIRKLSNQPDHLAKLEQALLDILRSDASLAAQRGVCKRLGLIATERSVPVLSPMLTKAETSDMARYALEPIPSKAVDAALRQAMANAHGNMRAGIINSIGNRRDSEAVSALGGLLVDKDDTVAQAAAWALGRIGGPAAIRHLAARRNTAQGRVRTEILNAYLMCAERSAKEGRKAEAAAIFKELDTEGTPAPIRRAAAIGVRRTV